jgi:coatomer protein complex subunit alpha (xenin)
VWDTSGLRDKTVGGPDGSSKYAAAGDVFGSSDAVVKYVLEGHDRGVNWASFHPTMPYVVSGADDRLIKLWRMNDTKAWEMDTLRGHFNNVSCVLYYQKNGQELILSNSEDRTIRVWDGQKRTGIHTFRRENDRFWTITTHRTANLIAVGHDAGMVVFKLDTERPIAMCSNNLLYVVQDRNVNAVDLDKAGMKSNTISSRLRSPPNAMTSGMKLLMHNTYNRQETNVLVFYSQDGGCYDLFVGPNDTSGGFSDPKQGSAQAVCFTARNRFAVLQSSGSIGIYNLQNELSKKMDIPGVTPDYIYAGGQDRILLKCEEKIMMYDLTAKKIIDELSVPGNVRYVVWSNNGNYVAFMSKHNVVLAGKNLEYYHSFHENIRVKSGAWDENGVFVYATQSHVKYCLPNGDSGIIHSLPNPIYIHRVSKQNLWFIDRSQTIQKQRLNCTEYLFKLSLHKRNFNDVKMWIQNGRLCGNVVIGYLKQKGFPEVALHFVEDNQTRFNLALEYGHIEEAMNSAQELDDQACWNRLGLEALRQGNQQIVESVYQKTKNFDALSFLYLITGNFMKLKKMLSIANMRKDVMSRFNNALMLGDIDERVKIMAEMGQVPLAALTAKTHNITEFVERLEEQLQGNDISSQIPSNAQLFLPPVPVWRPEPGESINWPLLKDTKAIFKEKAFEEQEASKLPEERGFDAMEEAPERTNADWEEEGDVNFAELGGAWGDDGLDGLDGLDGFDLPAETVVETKSSAVTVGDSAQTKWLKKRKMPADLIAAGEFEEALSVLKKRLGVINVDPLEPLFKQAYWATCSSLPGLPQSPSLQYPLLSNGNHKLRDLTPVIFFQVQYILDQVTEAHKLTSEGKFKESLVIFRSALQCIPLSVANDSEEESKLMEMIEVCRDYTTGMRLELTRKALPPEQVARNIELAAYFTCCKLKGSHSFLALQGAMATAFKGQNFVTAASFARRLLQGNFGTMQKPAESIAKARKLLAVCEQKASDAHEIKFDSRAPVEDFKMCSGSFTPIGTSDPTASCPYCGAVYHASFKGKLCDVCELSEIGANTLGIQLRPI